MRERTKAPGGAGPSGALRAAIVVSLVVAGLPVNVSGGAGELRVRAPGAATDHVVRIIALEGTQPRILELVRADGESIRVDLRAGAATAIAVVDSFGDADGWQTTVYEEPDGLGGRRRFSVRQRVRAGGLDAELAREDGAMVLEGRREGVTTLSGSSWISIALRIGCGLAADLARDDCTDMCNSGCGGSENVERCDFDTGVCGLINSTCSSVCKPTTSS